MQSRYLSLSPYNLVRIILGERHGSDTEADNVYTRAAAISKTGPAQGILTQDTEPGLFAYFQEFTVPDTGERLCARASSALARWRITPQRSCTATSRRSPVPRRTAWSCCGTRTPTSASSSCSIPIRKAKSTRCSTKRRRVAPIADVTDEYGAVHRVWHIVRTPDAIQALMADKKLLIADGHHRYETALAFRNENPDLPGADRVMMTFVNMHSPGLQILATHRLVNGSRPKAFPKTFCGSARTSFRSPRLPSTN